MLSLTLLPQDEYLWCGDDALDTTIFVRPPLYHQWRTYYSQASLIVNTHNTGTGKTRAALLRLLKRARDKGFENLYPHEDDVLFIAPTNELLLQHARDARTFCEAYHLPYRVLPITADLIDQYKHKDDFSEEALRRSAALHYILRDGGLVDNDYGKYATIYVVNPDIFYYATYFGYNHLDSGPLFRDFISLFNYVIIDELHYYNPKQLAAFLFFIKLSQQQGYIDSDATKRQFCILTATPRPQVTAYLKRTGLPIDWIQPDEHAIPPENRLRIRPVRVLAPVQLQLYTADTERDAIGDLLQLVRAQRSQLVDRLHNGEDGAVISSSLGTINRIHHELRAVLADDEMGRITGAQIRGDRQAAQDKHLILATPTVDIGYNFERSEDKERQNIDFLYIDAYAGDELVQRLGRAARVLSKEQQNYPSHVYAVVDLKSYKEFQAYDGQTISREQFAAIAMRMPRKNDIYGYLRSGAIVEAFRTILQLERGMSDQERVQLNVFFQELQNLFRGSDDQHGRLFNYYEVRSHLTRLCERQQAYGQLRAIPSDLLDTFQTSLYQSVTPTGTEAEKQFLKGMQQRVKDAMKAGTVERSRDKAFQWVLHDLSEHFKDRARFSFRESFQPPTAVIYDPHRIHSDQIVSSKPYSALHFIKYYKVQWFDSFATWRAALAPQHSELAVNSDTEHTFYCRLSALREEPLKIGLRLDAMNYTRTEWDENVAYRVTALHGLNIVVTNDHTGLQRIVRQLFAQQFVPTFAVWNDPSCATLKCLRALRNQVHFSFLPLEVAFAGGQRVPYFAILGTMAFQICAEIPFWAVQKDIRRTIKDEDQPIFS